MGKIRNIKAISKENDKALGRAVNIDDLAGSLRGEIKLSDKELRHARDQFSKQWPRKLS